MDILEGYIIETFVDKNGFKSGSKGLLHGFIKYKMRALLKCMIGQTILVGLRNTIIAYATLTRYRLDYEAVD